jgi:putative membrane protein
MSTNTAKDKKFVPLIVIATIAIPLVVTLLAFAPKFSLLGNFDYHILPMLNAIINGTAFFVLIAAVIAIKNKKIPLHRALMTTAIVLSVIFLVSYILFHAATEPTPFGGTGAVKGIYYFILITHILLSAAIVPLVLITYVRGLSAQFDRHRKIAKITFPLWLYVTSTGVIVYLMIAPYYPQ